MYKASELREKSREELLQLISELKGKLLALRFEAATGQLSETHLPSATKKDIALIFTVLKEKEQGIVIKTKETTVSKKDKKEKVEEKSTSTTDDKKEVVEESTITEQPKEEKEVQPTTKQEDQKTNTKEEGEAK